MALLKKLKPLHYLLGGVALLFIVALIGKSAGWFGKGDLMKVAVEKAQKRTIVETVLANGKIQPEVEVKLSSEISGEIVGLYIKEGDSVKQGQLLARVNPELVLAAIDRGEAAINSAKAQLATSKARLNQLKATFDNNIKPSYERNQKLFKDKVISQAEYDMAKASYEAGLQDLEAMRQSVIAAEYSIKSAEATQKETREQLSRTNIYAPITGIVTKLSVEVGERVVGTIQMAGTEMIRIADLNRMEAQVDVSESDVVRVSLGDSVMVEVDAYPGKIFRGIVREIANSSNSSLAGMADQVTNFGVKITLLNDSYEALSQVKKYPFRPGMSTSVEIMTNRADNVLTVPISSVTVRAFDAEGKILSDRDLRAASKKEGDESEEGEGEGADDENLVDKAKKAGGKLEEVLFVYEGGKAVARKVKTGIQDDRYIQILEGISDSSQVISAPFSAISKKLKDGEKVEKTAKDKLFED